MGNSKKWFFLWSLMGFFSSLSMAADNMEGINSTSNEERKLQIIVNESNFGEHFADEEVSEEFAHDGQSSLEGSWHEIQMRRSSSPIRPSGRVIAIKPMSQDKSSMELENINNSVPINYAILYKLHGAQILSQVVLQKSSDIITSYTNTSVLQPS